MTLRDDVIEQASDGDVAATPRKLMIVAHRLGAEQLLTWLISRLRQEGWPTVEDPAAQEVATMILNVIYGPVAGLAQGNNVIQRVPVTAGDHDVAGHLSFGTVPVPCDACRYAGAARAEDRPTL